MRGCVLAQTGSSVIGWRWRHSLFIFFISYTKKPFAKDIHFCVKIKFQNNSFIFNNWHYFRNSKARFIIVPKLKQTKLFPATNTCYKMSPSKFLIYLAFNSLTRFDFGFGVISKIPSPSKEAKEFLEDQWPTSWISRKK